MLTPHISPDAVKSRPRNSAKRSGLKVVQAGGFILITVLLLIALVTVLVVGTSMLARIERGAVNSETSTETARQNALFGLNVALAQLQKTAGPDQAITARADILDSNPATAVADGFPAVASAQPNNPGQAYWTGVWPTGSAPPDAPYVAALPTPSSAPAPQRTTSLGNPSPSTTQTTTAQKVQKATWLVSDPIDPSTNLPAVLDPTATPSPVLSKQVTLAKNLPDLTGKSTTVNVGAPLVPMFPSAGAASPTGTPAGKYAYWVSDEGVKAKVNLTDPTYTGAASNGNSGFVQSQLHFVGPQALATQDGLFGTNANDIRDPKYAPDVPKVSTLQSLGYVQGTASTPFATGVSGSAAAAFSPDVTTSSYGVLADVRDGGLKLDMSQLFEDPANQLNAYLSALATANTADLAADQKVWEIIEPSYDAYNNQDPTDFGVRFQSLYNYYSLYKNTALYPSTGPSYDLNHYSFGNPGTSAPQIDERVFSYASNPHGTVPQANAQQPGEYYMPHVVACGLYFAVSSVQGAASGANAHTYNLIVYAEPRIVLYNPYNVTLTSSTTKPFTTKLNSNIVSRTWTIAVNGTTVQSEPFGWAATGANELALQLDPAANFVLKPGELRVYGLGTTLQAPPSGNPLQGNLINFTSKGLLGNKVGQAQWWYVPDDGAAQKPPVTRWPDPNSTTSMWQGTVPDSSEVVVTFAKNQGLVANDGYYSVVNNPGVWPNGTFTSTTIGRWFSGNPNEGTGTSTADLGTIANMQTAGANYSAAKPFGYFVVRGKGLTQSETETTQAFNPLPTFSSADGEFNPLPAYFDNTNQDIDFSLAVQNPVGSLTDLQLTTVNGAFNTFWGQYDVAQNANDPIQLVMRDVPRQPMVSLGQFMHMPLRTSMNIKDNAADTNSCMMGVGGSLADPYFALTAVVGNNNNKAVANFDDNFLMNQALFDKYYFSTLPPPSAVLTSDSSYGQVLPAMTTGTTAFKDANIKAGTCTLPNARMSFYRKNGVVPQTTVSTAQNYLTDYQKASANLLLNGAFNVNSTSMPAWRALLSSLAGNAPTGGLYTSAAFAPGQYPIYRFLSPFAPLNSNGSLSPVTTSSSPNPWASINLLADATNVPAPAPSGSQVTQLATAIVKQVKRLGPFLSMADFLNRRLTTATDSYGPGNASASIGLRGALQAAIDDTNINAGVLAMGSATKNTTVSGRRATPPTAIMAQLPNNTAIGVPGCLMQQDLVQCFSPVMTVRSDTFLVRCYGEADSVKTGATQGRAWGEAIVQRLPDFVDQTDPALSANGNLGDATPIAKVSITNQTFGRRFKVVSFRWLNETDL